MHRDRQASIKGTGELSQCLLMSGLPVYERSDPLNVLALSMVHLANTPVALSCISDRKMNLGSWNGAGRRPIKQ
jgi:hypothetical protein